jgi:hypothetical protein
MKAAAGTFTGVTSITRTLEDGADIAIEIHLDIRRWRQPRGIELFRARGQCQAKQQDNDAERGASFGLA